MGNLLERKSVLIVKKYLKKVDPAIQLIELDTTARTAQDAANSLKQKVGAIVKSLIFKNKENKEYYLCLVSGDKYISLEKLSKIIGHKIVKANADECKEITGFSIGGVAPVAHSTPPSRIFIDENLNRFDMVYAAAGNPYVVFGITFYNLRLITRAEIQKIID